MFFRKYKSFLVNNGKAKSRLRFGAIEVEGLGGEGDFGFVLGDDFGDVKQNFRLDFLISGFVGVGGKGVNCEVQRRGVEVIKIHS